MEKLQKYRHVIRELIAEEAHPYCQSNDVETGIIFNTEHDRSQLTYIGWKEQKRIFNVILYLDIKDGKIWIQYNGTETAILLRIRFAIAKVLTDKGVPASDIVFGFHSPFKGQFSGYALA